MEDQESYLNEEEVNQGLNKIGNAATQFGQGMYGGIKSGIKDFKDIKNHGLQSSNKDLDDTKKEPEIPEPKNQNPNSTGAPNQLPGSDNSNNPLDKNKDEEGTKKDDDKKEKSKKDDDKDEKKKKDKKSNQKNKKSGIINGNTKQSIKDIIKSKQSIAIIVLIGFCIVLFVVSALIGASSIHVIYHNITEDFLCSSEETLSIEYKNAKNTFGWKLKETGEYEVKKVKKMVYTDYETPNGTISIPHEAEVEEKTPIYQAVFSTGVDIDLQEGTEIYAVQPGVITKITNDYIEISHNSNNENDYDNKNYITRYYNYGTFEDDLQEEDAVVKGTLLSTFVSGTFHFELLEDDKNVDSNILFGYSSANTICGNKDSIKTTRGTLENEDIKLLYDNKCDGNVEYLGVSTAKDMMCNGYNSGIFSDELVNYDGFKARETAPTRTNSFYYEQNSNNYGKYLEGECAMYATCRAQEILSTMGINKSFTTNVNGGQFCSSVSGYQTGMTPKQGSLVSWSGGKDNKYGHVAVVEKVNADGSIVISEMYAKLGYYGSSAWDIIKVSPNPKETRKYNCSANGSGCWQMRTIPANRINDAGWGSYRLNCFIYLLGD